MQSQLHKRSFLSVFDTTPSVIDASIPSYQNPRKKLKKTLQIDISDAFGEKPALLTPSAKSTNPRKLSFGTPTSIQPCILKPSVTPRFYERAYISMEPNMFVMENDTLYDDLYQEEEAFNTTMKKCHRKRMEDRVTCEVGLNSVGGQSFFFGIYDGHRNSYVSDFLQKNFHNHILNYPEIYSHPKLAIKEAFTKIDQEILKNQATLNIQGGSTALCAFINSNTLHLANVGDSKAIIIRNNQPVTLNVEHRASNEEERKNIENRGGVVFEKKSNSSSRFLVQGALELTRSIGDPSYKEFITCEPDIIDYTFDKNDQYIIMASDGFWNEINEEETAKLVKAHGQSQGLSKFLVGEALKKKPYNIDNISMTVVDIQKLLKITMRLCDEN